MSHGYEFRGMYARAEMVSALNRYAQMRCPVGGFLTALLSNDLKEACGRADDDNLHNIPALVAYCYNELPSPCWGSPEKVANWLNAGRVDGVEAEDSAATHEAKP